MTYYHDMEWFDHRYELPYEYGSYDNWWDQYDEDYQDDNYLWSDDEDDYCYSDEENSDDYLNNYQCEDNKDPEHDLFEAWDEEDYDYDNDDHLTRRARTRSKAQAKARENRGGDVSKRQDAWQGRRTPTRRDTETQGGPHQESVCGKYKALGTSCWK